MCFLWVHSPWLIGQGAAQTPSGLGLRPPTGQCRVERSDQADQLNDGAAGTGDIDHCPVRFLTLGRLCLDPLFPGCGDFRREMEGLDAGAVELKVFPEVQREHPGQIFQRGVVHDRLAFGEVIDDDVTGRPELKRVASHPDLAGMHGNAAERGGRVPRERPQPLERGVEERVTAALQAQGLDLAKLQAVADGDAVDHAALGREQDRELVASRSPSVASQSPEPASPQAGGSRLDPDGRSSRCANGAGGSSPRASQGQAGLRPRRAARAGRSTVLPPER